MRTESLAAVVIAEVPAVVWRTLCVIADGAQQSPVTVRMVTTVAAAVCEETMYVRLSEVFKVSTLSTKIYHSALKNNS